DHDPVIDRRDAHDGLPAPPCPAPRPMIDCRQRRSSPIRPWPRSRQGGSPMLSREDNERLTRVGPATPMGVTLRRYWTPALLARELPAPDCPPVRVRLLG